MQNVAQRIITHLRLIKRIGNAQDRAEAAYFEQVINQADADLREPAAVNFATAMPKEDQP